MKFSEEDDEYFKKRQAARAALEDQSGQQDAGSFNLLLQGLGASLQGRSAGAAINAARGLDSARTKDALTAFDSSEDDKLKIMENREKVRQYLEQKQIDAANKQEQRDDTRSYRAQQDMNRLEDRRFDRNKTEELRQANLEDKKVTAAEKVKEASILKASEKLSPAQDIVNTLRNVESKLGFAIDDAKIVNDELIVNGKPRDLPGVSVPGAGRVNFFSSDARSLNAAMSKIFNVELKDRSGAAVTTSEMERLKTEFASGKFNSEVEMIQALKDYKLASAQALRNREAGFRPEVLQAYQERGGQTSADIDAAVAMVTPSGAIKMIPKNQVAAAIKAGGRPVNPVAGRNKLDPGA